MWVLIFKLQGTSVYKNSIKQIKICAFIHVYPSPSSLPLHVGEHFDLLALPLQKTRTKKPSFSDRYMWCVCVCVYMWCVCTCMYVCLSTGIKTIQIFTSLGSIQFFFILYVLYNYVFSTVTLQDCSFIIRQRIGVVTWTDMPFCLQSL